MQRVARKARSGCWLAVVTAGAVGGLAQEVVTATGDGPEVVAAESGGEDAVNWARTRAETFAVVWQTVNEAYFDEKFGGVDWTAVREQYAARLDTVADKAALRGLLQQMLGELKRSHFAVLPREAAVFTPAERVRIGTAGLRVAWADGALVVAEVTPGGAASAAGLAPGDEVKEVAGVDLAQLRDALERGGVPESRLGYSLAQWAESRFRAPVDTEVPLVAARGGERVEAVTLATVPHEGRWSEPVGNFPSFPLEVRRDAVRDGIGYLHFSVFAREVMRDVRDYLKSLPQDAGLILDLRGNPGGLGIMAPGISGWLCEKQTWLGTMQLRQGVMPFVAHPQEGLFRGPVAILIDGTSASTSEIMAAGLQAAGRARLFGETSAGAALPSSFKQLPTGDLFQFAMADVVTPRGVSIEGLGVTPDTSVARTREDYAAGRDPVREAAAAWLQDERQRIFTGQTQKEIP